MLIVSNGIRKSQFANRNSPLAIRTIAAIVAKVHGEVKTYFIDISSCVGYTHRKMRKPVSPTPHLPVQMHVGAGERLHKIFVIHNSSATHQHAPGVEFRIFTKEKPDGSLELLGYQYQFDGEHEHQSNVLRAPAVPAEMLLTIIRHLVEQTKTDIKQLEVIDLTPYRTRLDQADRLAQHDLLEAFEFE